MRAREADPLSAFGGIVGLNRPIDVETARALDVDVHRSRRRAGIWRMPAAVLPILGDQGNLRVVTASFDRSRAGARRAVDSRARWLVQARDRVVEAGETWPGHDAVSVVTRRAPTAGRVDGAAIRLARRART